MPPNSTNFNNYNDNKSLNSQQINLQNPISYNQQPMQSLPSTTNSNS